MSVLAREHEVPFPPPEQPERERERRPEYEHLAITVGEAGAWVADLQRTAQDFASRHGGVSLTVELDDGRRLDVHDVRPGPGAGFVTFAIGLADDERELSVRLDRVASVQLGRVVENERGFRVRRTGVGFGR